MTDSIEERVADAMDSRPTRISELDGGRIGSVHRVELANGRTAVAKVGETPLDVEAFMLRYLAEESDLPVPAVYHADPALLVLEFVRGDADHSPAVAEDAADHLARLHDRSADAFGFDRDTLTGPVRQPNPWSDSWIEFYRRHRLLRGATLASEDGPLSDSLRARVESVAADLESLLEEPGSGARTGPSLIHGDAWTTNVLSRDGAVRAFLDPATYYAHPEVELAYVDWTGTFGDRFFERYRERRGIAEGFFDRRRYVYRLYPLSIHVHLFGDRYADELAATLDRLGY